jgi:hypothetical protein
MKGKQAGIKKKSGQNRSKEMVSVTFSSYIAKERMFRFRKIDIEL